MKKIIIKQQKENINFWTKKYNQDLSPEQIRAIEYNLLSFFKLLISWQDNSKKEGQNE